MAISARAIQHRPYRLQEHASMTLTCAHQTIRILSGTAWISLRGEDHILNAGDTLPLIPGGDNLAVISPINSSQLSFELSQIL